MGSQVLVRALAAAARLQFTDSRALPRLGEVLLGYGKESPSIVRLTLLGMEPFDPRDAREAAKAGAIELGVPEPSPADAANFVGAIIGTALICRRLDARAATRGAYRLVVAAGYDVGRPLVTLYGLDDAWDAGWAGPNDQIERQTREAAQELVDRLLEVGRADLTDSEWELLRDVFVLRAF